MFATAVIDVVIGVIFSFLAISLASSAILEAISSILAWRADHLLEGMKTLVNDPGFTGLARQLYRQAAINPLGVRTAAAPADTVDLRRKPAYIASQQFATAMTDVLSLSNLAVSAGPPNVAAMKTAVTAALAPANPQIETMVKGMIDRSNGDLKQIETALAAWFDNGMDRLSGVYKRRTQLVSFAIALLLAGVLNVDTIRIAHVLWDRPTLADDLKLSPDAASKLCPAAGPCQLAANAEEALKVLDQYLPVGWWDPSAVIPRTPGQWASTLLGWLITAFATLFGAPFWFDTLQSVVRLKGTGPSPKETADKRAAAA